MAGRWDLPESVRAEYTPIVQQFINGLQATSNKETAQRMTLELTDTKLNPHWLETILEELGYTQDDLTHNGWQFDYWITMTKQNFKTLSIHGCGIVFTLNLSGKF